MLGGIALRSIDSWLDRFCYKHPKLGIPNLMTIIVVGNALVFLLDMFSGGGMSLSGLLSFNPYAILHGQIWRLFTFVFVPMSSQPFMLLLALYFYWAIGSTLERYWGTVKFTVFYAVGILLNIVTGFVGYLLMAGSVPNALLPMLTTVSMDYVNLSLFFAYATLFPDAQFLVFFLIPVKAKWLGILDGVLFLWGALSNLLTGNFAGALLPVVAVLNYVLFFWSDIRDHVSGASRQARHRRAQQTINFQKATREAQQQKGYIHKCAVCGKTDTDYPDMEFRYCSKCNGYYCYCMEHINNHVHVK